MNRATAPKLREEDLDVVDSPRLVPDPLETRTEEVELDRRVGVVDLHAVLDDTVGPEHAGRKPQLCRALDDGSARRSVRKAVGLIPDDGAIDGEPESVGPTIGGEVGVPRVIDEQVEADPNAIVRG